MTKRALIGVNLGGWLIPEKWLTPGLFAGTLARDLYELSSSDDGVRRLEKHFETFITETDFQWLQRSGVELVRIPVGYWTLDGDAPYAPAVKYLDWAMETARKYDIKVLIDLHATKGSQNGEMHAGKTGVYEWQKRRDYQDETITVLRRIAERYRDNPQFWGLELVNEPKLGWHYFTLLRFYRRAYQELTLVLRPGVFTVFHDAFHPLLLTGSLRWSNQFPVLMDVHWYALLPRILGRLTPRQYAWVQKLWYGSLLRIISAWQPVIVGEWSSVLPQRFFDRTPKNKHYELLAANVATQQKLYHHAAAAAYWNYKAEGAGMWNFRSLVESGTIEVK